jgi:hypothetical protein
MMPVDPAQPLSNFRGFNLRLAQPGQLATHLGDRPTWTCRTCGADWPCGPARERLLREYESDPTSLAMLMWTHLEHFSLDQGAGPLAGAFDRFIAWTR